MTLSVAIRHPISIGAVWLFESPCHHCGCLLLSGIWKWVTWPFQIPVPLLMQWSKSTSSELVYSAPPYQMANCSAVDTPSHQMLTCNSTHQLAFNNPGAFTDEQLEHLWPYVGTFSACTSPMAFRKNACLTSLPLPRAYCPFHNSCSLTESSPEPHPVYGNMSYTKHSSAYSKKI